MENIIQAIALGLLAEVDVSNKIWKPGRGVGGQSISQHQRWDRAQSNMLNKAKQLDDSGVRNIKEPPKQHDPVTQKKIDALKNKSE